MCSHRTTQQPQALADPETAAADSGDKVGPSALLRDALDATKIFEVLQCLARLTGLRITILDDQGIALATPHSPVAANKAGDAASTTSRADTPPQNDQGPRVVPIIVDGRQIGSIVAEAGPGRDRSAQTRQTFQRQAQNLGLGIDDTQSLLDNAERLLGPDDEAITQLLDRLANSILLIYHQWLQLRQRVDELTTVYRLTKLLSAHQDLQQVLDTAARSAAEVMKVKAASIRLLTDDPEKAGQLVPKAIFNLSRQYLDKGPVDIEHSELYQRTLEGEVMYVEDMATDPRVLYPEDARREGLVSMLSAPMIHMNRPVGVVRLYTGRQRKFSQFETDMLRAVGRLLGTAIENARLNAEHVEHERVQRQIRMAADVQRRMLPAAPPHLPPFDIAARCVPSLELGGDFYDFVNVDGHLGIAVGDVVGKGIAAGLLMASVRASLRAYAQDIYDLDEIISRVNVALTRDTLDNEFATLFYGVIDPSTYRMTYCNAGHEPPLLLHDGEVQRLSAGGMIVGIDADQKYDKGLVDLRRGDLVLFYTDGLMDAQNFKGERFGRHRIIQALRDVAGGTARDAVNHILWEMRRFVGLNPNIDDTTLVVIKHGP